MSAFNGLNFYPRSPCGERRPWACSVGFGCLFLSTLSLRRATGRAFLARPFLLQFLSTLSLRRATSHLSKFNTPKKYFYPRSPCGERRGCFVKCHCWEYFYPRSPCGERRSNNNIEAYAITFLSTLSLRRATQRKQSSQSQHPISIHALLAESDVQNYNACVRARISIHALLAESDLATVSG